MEELKKHIYDEHNGLHYTLVGDYYIPDLQLPEETRPIAGLVVALSRNSDSKHLKKTDT